jgi:hypothetical protein
MASDMRHCMPLGIRPTTADMGHILALGVRFFLPQAGHSVVHLGYFSLEYCAYWLYRLTMLV